MKKISLFLVLAGLLFSVSAPYASAHETHNYKIGNQTYQFVIGSLNEPIAVDDNTGVDLRVTKVGNLMMMHGEEKHSHDSAEGAVEGLDQSLQVELRAGEKTKTLSLSPKHGEAGRYTAKFYPTVQTTYTYRVFGSIDNTPVDLSFTCNPAGHPVAEEDKSEVNVSNGVTRTLKRGAFGCPVAKDSLGFPEASASLYELSSDMSNESGARTLGFTGAALGILALALGGMALRKK